MIAVCLRWLSAPSGVAFSPADQAALEWALRAGERWDLPVTALAVAPSAAEPMLREALAVGAAKAIRIDAPTLLPSAQAAGLAAAHLAEAAMILCGDSSLDRGSGSFPGFLAAALECQQALGLLHLELGDSPGSKVLRRLDGGRREELQVDSPAVLSVEGSTARLRRASLIGVRQAKLAGITVDLGDLVDSSCSSHVGQPAYYPYRPRARQLGAPVGNDARERILTMLDVAHAPSPGETVVLDPQAAAERIGRALSEWGYLN